jgi:hypothetical protein
MTVHTEDLQGSLQTTEGRMKMAGTIVPGIHHLAPEQDHHAVKQIEAVWRG